MKIAINCAFYQPRGGGIKEYIFNLTHHLAKTDNVNGYVLYVLQDQMEYAIKNLPNKFRIKAIPYKSAKIIDIISRSLFEQHFWTDEEETEKWDIFHSPFFHAPELKRAKLILTIHDLRFIRFPKTYTFLRYWFLKYKVKKSINNADHIIAISHFTKDEIIDAYKIEENKITVIHEAINLDRFQYVNNYKIEKDRILSKLENKSFLLSVGHIEPRKNYDRLINAFTQLKKVPEFNDLKLVIVGKKGHSYKNTLKLMDSTDGIYYLNFVEHSQLMWLYRHSSLFVFPSYYEGFGFPPLEAASLGTVSAVSKISSIPEICGNSVFYFDPYDVSDITLTLKEALHRKEEKQSELTVQLSKFSWEKNALETMSIYQKINRNNE